MINIQVWKNSIFRSIKPNSFPLKQRFSPNNEGENNLKYYAVDKVGNAEKVVAEKFVLDLSAPNSTIEKDGDFIGNTFAKNGKIGIGSEDKFSGVAQQYFAIDQGDLRSYYSTISCFQLGRWKAFYQFQSD